MLPRLTVRLQGITQNIAPEPKESGPQLTIRLNGIVRSVIPLPSKPFHNEPSDALMSWLRAWAEKRALSTANEASYHQDKQSELERSIHKPLRA